MAPMKTMQLRSEDGETPSDLELRFLLEADAEVRALDDGARRLAGYAAAFNVRTKIRSWAGEFEEVLLPGAFAESLRSKKDIRFLVEHDPRLLLARSSAGTLTLVEDAKGLRFETALPDTQLGRDTYENIRVKNYIGMSFGFNPLRMKQDFDDRGRLRSVAHESVDLREVTVTSMPAYPKTSVAIRSLFPPSAPPIGDLALRARVARLKA